MLSVRGFTLFELLIVMSLIAIVSAMAVPGMMQSSARNSVWTASETIGTQIRQARLKAISRNMSFQIRFDCPSAGQFRVLAVDSTINDTDRCDNIIDYDSGVFTMPNGVSYGSTPPLLEVNSRGTFESSTGIPATITVTSAGSSSRSLNMSATGQITFDVY
jgi:prepilin-type N-terminal cleavage/methylation domain-containing protein